MLIRTLVFGIGIASFGATVGCGETRTEQQAAPFPSSTGFSPEKFEFQALDGEVYSGTAVLGVNDAPSSHGALLHLVAQSKNGRKWAAQLTIGIPELIAGSATIALKPFASKANEGFVDDMSGPSPVFSQDGTATVTFKSGRVIAVSVSTSASGFAGTGGGKATYQCSFVRPPSEPASPGVLEVEPDPSMSSPFCSAFGKYL